MVERGGHLDLCGCAAAVKAKVRLPLLVETLLLVVETLRLLLCAKAEVALGFLLCGCATTEEAVEKPLATTAAPMTSVSILARAAALAEFSLSSSKATRSARFFGGW